MASRDMPKRSRSQQTGDAAVPRWQVLLEPHFVFRPETPDYGIDGEVEEFDRDDRATGLRYKVQLKSTDEGDLRRALSVRVSLSNANYWSAQDLPVLLVRYHRPSARFYVRWFHTFDAYRGGVTQSGLTFRWDENDAWRDGRAEDLAAEARAFLQLRSNRLRLPVPFAFEVDPRVVDPSAPELRIAMRAAASRRRDVVRLVDGAGAGAGRFDVRPDALVADLAGVTSATFDLPGGVPMSDPDQIAADLLCLAALAFARVGQADLAGRLAYTYLTESAVLEHPEAPWALSSSMVRARQIDEALELADQIDATARDDDPGLWFTLPILYHSASLSPRETELAVDVLSRRIDRRRERGDDIEEARACVNLANFFRRRAEPLLAIPLYDRALECDPVYADRQHFWCERAGVLFGAHRYDEAAASYARALELGADGFMRALEADALFFAGRFGEARSVWSTFVAEEPTRARAAEFLLKIDVVEDIADVLGIDEQSRVRPDLSVALIPGSQAPSPEVARSIAVAALGRDALDPRAWQVLAWTALVAEDYATYARYIRAPACLLEGDPDAWVTAIVMNHGVEGGGLVPEMIVTGERLTGGQVMPGLVRWAREFIATDERAAWLAEVEALSASIPPDDANGFAVRFLGEDDAVEEWAIASAEDGDL